MKAAGERNVSHIQSSYVKQHQFEQDIIRRRRRGLIRRLSLFAVITALTSFGVISTLISQAGIIENKKEELGKLEQEYKTLKAEQENLEDEIVKLNDEDYIIKIARRDYFLSNEGEVIFKLPENKADGSSY